MGARNKKAKYVTIEQVALLEVGRQELISGLGKLLCLEILSLAMDLKLPVVAQLYQTYGLSARHIVSTTVPMTQKIMIQDAI